MHPDRADHAGPAAHWRGLFRSAALRRALLAALVAVAAALLHGFYLPDLTLQFQMRSTLAGQAEIFWADAGERYAPLHSLPFVARADGDWHAYQLRLPAAPVQRLRFDPGIGEGRFALRGLVVRDGRRAIGFDTAELRAWHGYTHHVSPSDPGEFAFTAYGPDPYVEIRLPVVVGAWTLGLRALRLACIGLVAALGWWLLEWVAGSIRRRLPPAPAAVARLAERLGDDGVLRIDVRSLLAFAALGLAALLYVTLSLNQSSVGIWETTYPYEPVAQTIDLGSAKRIRSDEWKVQTPWVLNQLDAGEPWRNREIGGLSSPLLASMPVEGVLGWPHLKFAGFHLLGKDRGLSWWWAYKTFALLASFLWLLLILTRGNLAASLLGTGWIWVSSFTQWWLSSNLPEILVAFALGTVGALYAACATKRAWMVAGCVLVVYAVSNLALNLYPPFIVPLAYLGLAILAGFAAREGVLRGVAVRWRFRAGVLALAAVASGAYLAAFAHAAAESIEAVRNTVYPGHRVAVDWQVPLAKVVSGFFEAFRLGEARWPLPRMSSNASEASSFLLLAPLVLLLLHPRAWRERRNQLLLGLLAFCGIAGVWIAVPLPEPLQQLGSWTGWSLATPKRVVLALGVASVIACSVAFAHAQQWREDFARPGRRAAVVLALSAGVLLVGLWLRRIDPVFFSPTVLVLGWLATSLLGAALATGRTRLFAAGVAVCALPALCVNPLQSGLSALLDKPVLRAAATVGGAASDRWMVIGDNFFAQGLRAQGLSVFGGAQYLPDFRDMAVLDPHSQQAGVWNRYAYVSVLSDPGRRTPLFRRTRGDQYAIALDVCGPLVRRLGITRLAYTRKVPDADLRCLEPLPAPADSGVRLFRYRLAPGP